MKIWVSRNIFKCLIVKHRPHGLFLILFSFFLLCRGYAESNNKIINMLYGDWGAETWYKTLLKTNSPREALQKLRKQDKYLSCINFNNKLNKDGFYLIELNYSFNEGDNRIFNIIRPIDDRSKEYTLEVIAYVTDQDNNKLRVGGVEQTAIIKFINEDTIHVIIRKSHIPNSGWITGKFIRLKPSLTEFVNKTVLSGEYTDNKGKYYRFYDNGKLIWENKKIEYEINHYTNMIRCNYFTITNGTNTFRYAYEKNNNKLHIYKTKETEHILDKAEKPFLILNNKK